MPRSRASTTFSFLLSAASSRTLFPDGAFPRRGSYHGLASEKRHVASKEQRVWLLEGSSRRVGTRVLGSAPAARMRGWLCLRGSEVMARLLPRRWLLRQALQQHLQLHLLA